jgi:hypothetical protein
LSEDQDWRLKAELDVEDKRGMLDRLTGRARGPDVVQEIGTAVPHEVMITHDGKLLFAYAATQASMGTARRAIEAVLRRDGVGAHIFVSHWDEERDEWHQVDPPLSPEQQRAEEVAERDADKVETRTMVATAGRAIRTEVEQTMRSWADRLELECEIIEHPHLLTSQVAFTVTGPKRKIDEFARGLRSTELATMRTEREVMLSPL